MAKKQAAKTARTAQIRKANAGRYMMTSTGVLLGGSEWGVKMLCALSKRCLECMWKMCISSEVDCSPI